MAKGTCGVCGKLFTLDQEGNVPHHDYRESDPKDCIGGGFMPIEVSRESLVYYISAITWFIEEGKRAITYLKKAARTGEGGYVFNESTGVLLEPFDAGYREAAREEFFRLVKLRRETVVKLRDVRRRFAEWAPTELTR